MARARLGPLVIDLRGKLGNSVFDNYKGIHIVRALPSYTTNPQSTHQSDVRSALAEFVNAWRGLPLDKKQLWTQMITKFPRLDESDARMNRGGLITVPRGPFSGYNAFIACNMNRYTSGYSPVTDILEDAPINAEVPEAIKNLSATKAGRVITVAWEYINPGPREERLEIWIRSIDAGIHPQLIYSEDRNADGNTDISTVRKTSGIDVELPNGVYQLQAMIVNQYGLTSQPSELVYIQLGGEDVFTYFSTRQQVVNLNNVVADIAWTTLDLSSLIPAGAHTAILLMEHTNNVAGGAPSYFAARKDATQAGACKGLITPATNAQGGTPFICPITTDRKIDYMVDITAPMDVDVDVYLIGYIE